MLTIHQNRMKNIIDPEPCGNSQIYYVYYIVIPQEQYTYIIILYVGAIKCIWDVKACLRRVHKRMYDIIAVSLVCDVLAAAVLA